jgi:hypothetical protein
LARFPTPAGRVSFAGLDSPFVRQKINFSMVGWREGFFGVFWLPGVFSGWQLRWTLFCHAFCNQRFSWIFPAKY